MVNAMPRNGDNPMGMMFGNSSRTNRDGTFTLAGLPPGDYILESRTMQIMTSGSGDMMSFRQQSANLARRSRNLVRSLSR